MKTNILILAAGHPAFEAKDGGYPLCLTEIDGQPLIERIVANTRTIKQARYSFALRDDDIEEFHLDSVVSLLVGSAHVIRVPEGTRGSGCTALMAACRMDPDAELLVLSANEFVDLDFAAIIKEFREGKRDAGVLHFRSVHPRYSYVRLNSEGLVSEAAQQNPISHHATTGAFWFSRASDFVEAIKNTIRKDAGIRGQYFIAPCLNEMILKQARVGAIEILSRQYHPLKTERQLHQFEIEAMS